MVQLKRFVPAPPRVGFVALRKAGPPYMIMRSRAAFYPILRATVILVEPPRSAWDVHFRLFGVPVRVHPFFWLVTLLIAARPQVEAADAIIFVIASFVSILIHELGHAAAIAYYGWRPRITLYSLGGLASYDREYSDTFESYSGNSGAPRRRSSFHWQGRWQGSYLQR